MAPRTPFLLRTTTASQIRPPAASFHSDHESHTTGDSGNGSGLFDSLFGEVLISGACVCFVLVVWLVCGVLMLLRVRRRRYVHAARSTPTGPVPTTIAPPEYQREAGGDTAPSSSAGASSSSSANEDGDRRVNEPAPLQLPFAAPLPYSIAVIDAFTTRLTGPCPSSDTFIDSIRPPAYEEIYKAPRNN